MPRLINLAMRIICFCAGLARLFGVSLKIKDEPAAVILAYAVLSGFYFLITAALLVLSWALPMKKPP